MSDGAETPKGNGESPAQSDLEQNFFDKTLAELRDEAGLDVIEEGEDGEVEGEAELQRLLSPKQSTRHPILASAVILASLFALYWLWEDFSFFLRSNTPQKIGSAIQAVKSKGKLQHNTYITLEGAPITQSMATAKLSSVIKGRSKTKAQWFILAGTDNKVIVRSKFVQTKRSRHRTLRGTFTGRLRLLKKTRSGKAVKLYYKRQSIKSPLLRPFHRFSAAEVLRNVGKARAVLTDLEGKKVDIRRDAMLEIFVAFPHEYEYALHSDFQAVVNGILVSGGRSAPKCDREAKQGRGGDLYLKPDPKVFTLDAIRKRARLDAADGVEGDKPGDPPLDGKDLIIPVPPGTKVFNAGERKCRKVCAGRRSPCLKHCRPGKDEELPVIDKMIRVATGAACGKGAGEKHKIDLHLKPYASPKRAEAYVASLGHPYILTEGQKGAERVKFVVRFAPAVGEELIKKQRMKSAYTISLREEVYRVRWRHLRRERGGLFIARAARSFPDRYEVKTRKGKKRLVVAPTGPTLYLPKRVVVRADVSLPLILPDDAYLLEEGIKPATMWLEPFPPGIPVLYALLGLFIILNLLALRSWLKG